MKNCILAVVLVSIAWCCAIADDAPSGRWSEQRANEWFAKQPWLVGCNYIPSSAINQLEMWQVETFDLKTIDRELGWAESLGFTSIRVFLHHLPWEQDSLGFLQRIEQFLAVADKHKIGVMLVVFDAVWDPNPKPGKQHAPRPHVHNSGWVQSPGADVLSDPVKLDALKPYVQGVVGEFKDDRRVQVWDLFNEPDNPNTNSYGKQELPNKAEAARQLLEKTFAWAREVRPSQPLTSGIWRDFGGFRESPPIFQSMLTNSDVISFHNYSRVENVKQEVEAIKQKFNRPVICTEYMARPLGSTFDPVLGYLKSQRIGAYCWGFVDGKSQTIYPWETWANTYTAKPETWFHDIFHHDGTPYSSKEVEYIRRTTGQSL
ncbi:MAG: cellulase family glycosylhydrolase [Pirellulales bacterium]|nr:cellulase family glycosylhydrolase [Pirellulales bacterium]